MTPAFVSLVDRRAALGLGAAAMALAGCSGLLGSGPALDAYDLRPPSDLPQAAARAGLELVIEAPAVPGALNTDRILIRPDPLQAQYLPGARWTQDAPEVLRTLFVQSFEETGALRQAGRRPLASFAEYRLSTEVLAFHIDATTAPPQAVLRLAARLVDDRGGVAPVARSFAASVAVAEGGTLGYVRALNAAAGQVTAQIIDWALGRMGIAARRRPSPSPAPAPVAPASATAVPVGAVPPAPAAPPNR
jgi:cholesterol transport system auxiliary component